MDCFMNKYTVLGFVSFLSIAVATVIADQPDSDWTQWRGSERDSQVAGKWPVELNESNLKTVWTKPLGPSYSGPIVLGDSVFVTETRDKKDEFVFAFDKSTGEQKWEASWPGAMSVPMFAAKNGSWIRATPATDGERLFVAGMLGRLVCLNVESGEKAWEVVFSDRYGVEKESFGHVCSPLIIDADENKDKFVYVQCNAGFVKLNRLTGEEVWRTLDGETGIMSGGAFSSPIVATIAGMKQIVVQTRTELAGVEIENGSVLWRRPIPNFRGMNILTPTVFGDTVFTSSYNNRSFGIGVSKADDKLVVQEKWTAASKAYMSSPVIVGGHAYVHLQSKRVACIDLTSGETKWVCKKRFGSYWSMVANGDQILALDSKGVLYLLNANPEKFELIGESKLATNDSWAHLAIVGNQLFVRGIDSITAYEWKD